MSTGNFPIDDEQLSKFAVEACESTLGTTTAYDHSRVSSWNTTIINALLKSLLDSTNTTSSSPYKYAVNSTIIQHLSPVSSGAGAGPETVGRRGMHSATGAYWNSEKDGMFSYKYESGGKREFDVVISIVWVAVV